MRQNLKIVLMLLAASAFAASCQKDGGGNTGQQPQTPGGFEEPVPERPDYVNANLIYYGNGGDDELPDEWLLNLYTDMEVVGGNPIGPGQYLCINFYAPVNQAQEPSLNYLKGQYGMPSSSGLAESTYIQGEIYNIDTPLGSITMPGGTFYGDIPAGEYEFEPDLIREGSFSITANEDGTWTIDGILVGTQYTKRYFSYTGEFNPVDNSDQGSSQDIPNSNLKEDIELDGLTEARLLDKGDFFVTGENNYRLFLLYLAEKGVDISADYPAGTGRLLHLELLVPADADPQDGIFDICYATGPLPRALALPVFLSAKEGKHVTNRHVTMGRARTVSIDFTDGAYPAQADGEALELRRAEIDLLPRALTVLAPAR